MSNKRNAEEMGADVEDTTEIKKQCIGIENLVFLFFTAASCGLCQGCDLCHPEVCAPKEANAIEKDGIIYKQIGRGFDQTFASLTCLFIRMRANFKSHSTPTAKKPDHNGRLKVSITDDNGKPMTSQALKFASLAWGQVTQLAKVGTAGMPLRDFGRAYQVDHIDNNKTNNNVSNAMIMTKAEHHAKTKQSTAQIANRAMSLSAPCTMTVFASKGIPLLDSERNPIIKNYPYRKEVMDDYKLKSHHISSSIKREDTTMNSLVKIKYKGQDCLAQFSWYNLPDLEGEIWKPVTKADHKTMGTDMSEIFEYWVSNMSRFKFVTKSTQNERIRDFRGKERPKFMLMGKDLLFYRVVALVFHPDQLNAKIAELKAKTGKLWTFATLEVDHIDFDPKNNYANNLQFLTPDENKQRSRSRPCRIWEIGSDTKNEYPSLTAAAKDIGYKSATSVHTILNNKHKKWRGEYL
jgi:hypothetical protein